MDEMSILTAASGHHARISMGKKWDPRESDDDLKRILYFLQYIYSIIKHRDYIYLQ